MGVPGVRAWGVSQPSQWSLLGDTGGGVGWGLLLFVLGRAVWCHGHTEVPDVPCPLRWAPSS